MTKTLKSILSYVLVMAATGFMLWFALKNIDAPEGTSKFDFIKATWDIANKSLFLLSGLLAILSHLVRAERWRLMLQPIGYKVGIFPTFFSVMVGYFVNLVIPRGGELSRCLNLFRLNKVPVETSAGTVVAERLIDVLFLLLFIGSSFLVEYDKLSDLLASYMEKRSQAQNATQEGGSLWWIVAILGLVAGLGIIWFVKKGKTLDLKTKLASIWQNMQKGLLSIFTLEKRGLFVLYSLTIWVLYFLMAWVCMLAFEETKVLGLEAALSIFTLGSIAMALPVPGGTGSYHILVPAGLSLLYGMEADKALAFTIVFHAWQTLILIIVGFISMIGSQLLAPKS
jgi:glycosyltransferase 2 family protein